MTQPALRIETPRAFLPLLGPERYKGAYGGRGGAKSHFFAEMMIERCYSATTRCVCVREVQNSIKESVHQLLKDKIAKFNLEWFFDVQETQIKGANGSLIIFRGMQSYNSYNIKSLEGFDVVWWEEAAAASAKAFKLLRPTIRKEGSQLWFSWNPEDEDDPVDAFFRGPVRHPNSVCVRVGWQDNPWFPSVLAEEKDADYASDKETADHVWGGNYEKIIEGAYYARQMSDVEREGRVLELPYDPRFPVLTGWDIGVDDYTGVWFFQVNGLNVRAIEYHEFSGIGPQDIIPECMPELMPDKDGLASALQHLGRAAPYKYGRHYFPHDVKVREWGGGAKTRYQTLMGLGVKPIHVGVAQNPSERIQATRRLLPIVSFDRKRTHLGRKRLRKYRRSEHSVTGQYGIPLKDGNDHGADAFGEFAVNCGIYPKPKTDSKPKTSSYAPMRPQQEESWRV